MEAEEPTAAASILVVVVVVQAQSDQMRWGIQTLEQEELVYRRR